MVKQKVTTERGGYIVITWSAGEVTITRHTLAIKWKLDVFATTNGGATFELLENRLQTEILNDPDGFAEFACCIRDAMKLRGTL